MAVRLMKVSHIKGSELAWTKATLYKLHHLNRYPGLFLKIGASLFVDLDAYDQLVESCKRKTNVPATKPSAGERRAA